jgi:hypothetical protein
VTGEIWGALTTRESFSNYHLRLDVKWGEKKWEPRLAQPRNSGLLYHCTGPHGAFWNTWKRSLEFEVQEADMGDLYPLGGTRGEVVFVKPPSKTWIFDPGAGELTTVGDPGLGPGVESRGAPAREFCRAEWRVEHNRTLHPRPHRGACSEQAGRNCDSQHDLERGPACRATVANVR